MRTKSIYTAFARQFAGPIDIRSVFDTKDLMDEYIITNKAVYAGMVCYVIDEESYYLIEKLNIGGEIKFVPTQIITARILDKYLEDSAFLENRLLVMSNRIEVLEKQLNGDILDSFSEQTNIEQLHMDELIDSSIDVNNIVVHLDEENIDDGFSTPNSEK